MRNIFFGNKGLYFHCFLTAIGVVSPSFCAFAQDNHMVFPDQRSVSNNSHSSYGNGGLPLLEGYGPNSAPLDQPVPSNNSYPSNEGGGQPSPVENSPLQLPVIFGQNPQLITPSFPGAKPFCINITNTCGLVIMATNTTEADWRSFFYDHEKCIQISQTCQGQPPYFYTNVNYGNCSANASGSATETLINWQCQQKNSNDGVTTAVDNELCIRENIVPASTQSCVIPTALTDFLPSMDYPQLRFGTGVVVNNVLQISPVLPAIPGPVSAWYLAQWNPQELVTPNNMLTNTNFPLATDAYFGAPNYNFVSPDTNTHVSIYTPPGNHPIYELYTKDGALGAGGGRDILISAGLTKPHPTFDHTLNFSAMVKASHAYVEYDTPTAEKSGAVLAQSGFGFVISFPSPVNGLKSTLFMQVTIIHSGATMGAPLIAACTLYDNGSLGINTVGTLSYKTFLPFVTDPGPLHPIQFSLNDYWNTLFKNNLTCSNKKGNKSVSFKNIDLSQVTLDNFYTGPETENEDQRSSSTNLNPQGTAELALQFSDIQITGSQ